MAAGVAQEGSNERQMSEGFAWEVRSQPCHRWLSDYMLSDYIYITW